MEGEVEEGRVGFSLGVEGDVAFVFGEVGVGVVGERHSFFY